MAIQSAIHTGPSRSSLGRTAAQSPSSAHTLGEQLDLIGASVRFARNEEIFSEEESADYLYKVVSGTVRTYKLLSDGRRQIGAFYVPGDIFGLEIAEQHTFSAEAVTDATILVIKRSAIAAIAARDSEVAQQLLTLTGRQLHRVQDHLMLLVKTAQERVAGFLLEMAARAPAANEIDLPMSRQDIADYLGLTIETVSRTLTQLATTAAIEVPTSRRIVLRNRSALDRMNA
jgi:CRP-like cAMP-binding protein